MKRFYLTIASFLLFSFIGFSQIKIALDSILYRSEYKDFKKYLNINIFDSLKIEFYTIRNEQVKGSYLLINNLVIDSSGLYAWFPVCLGNEIIFKVGSDEMDKSKLIAYSLFNKTFRDCNYSFHDFDRSKYLLDKGYSQLYNKEDEDYIRLYVIDPITRGEKLFVDFSSYVEKVEYPEIGKVFEAGIDDIYFINESKAIVKLGINQTAEGFGGFRYFIVDNGAIQEITKKVIKDKRSNTDIVESRISFITEDKKYIREITVIYNAHEKYSHLKDNNYNIIGEVLGLGYFEGLDYSEPINGINLQNGRIKNYFLNSTLNNKTQVIIPYKFIPALDIAMYKAFNNNILTKDEVKTFSKYEFGILRNLIFAKHNYDFSSEFYQAYFNLYAFYNAPEMQSSRVKDVNSKLTQADKANLKLIKEAETNK